MPPWAWVRMLEPGRKWKPALRALLGKPQIPERQPPKMSCLAVDSSVVKAVVVCSVPVAAAAAELAV